MKTKHPIALGRALFYMTLTCLCCGQRTPEALAYDAPKITVNPNSKPGVLELNWDTSARGYWLQSSSILAPNVHWTLVDGVPNPILTAGSYAVPFAGGPVERYFLLSGPQRVNVAEQEAADRHNPTSLTVLLKPDFDLVQMSNSMTFVAIVAGYPTNLASSLLYSWQWNKQPHSSVLGSTNLTWRDLHIEADTTNFVVIPGSPTNSNFYTIPAVTTNDVAYYRVVVTSGTNTASSLAAPLWMWQQTNSVLVYGTPVAQASSGGSCPGTYTTRIDYGGGFYPAPAGPYVATAQLSDSNTHIVWYDYYGYGYGCGLSALTVNVVLTTVPHYFTVYTSDSVVFNPYTLYLQNFH